MKNMTKLLAAAALCALSSVASAVTIDGSIAFGTAIGASWAPTGGTGIADATGVQFNSGLSGFAAQVTTVGAAPNDYAGTLGTDVAFSDFTFAPLAPPTTLWSFTTGGGTTVYSFDMTSVVIQLQSSNALTLSGNGLANITGFEETAGTWTLSLDSSQSVFSFSSTAAAAPEPALALLLGTGLLGFGVARKMRKTA